MSKELAELLYPNNKYTTDQIEKMYPPRKLKENALVTRFAPSPTGFLHLGHFFQSVVDKFIALKSGGKFYFRLEDTDQKREVAGADKYAYDKISEYGFVPDEGWTPFGDVGDYGPYRQSERLEIYKAYAKKLVEIGRAYPCFCDAPEGKEEVLENREQQLEETSTLLEHDVCRDLSLEEVKENLKKGKPWALRLKSMNTAQDKTIVHDLVRGNREIQANLKDAVLMKSNGIPPYPFAHPIDDHLMHTSVVVRGEEWFSSVALHNEIHEALGFEPMRYIHTAVICKIDEETGNKRKFSKRKDPEFNVEYFYSQGYPRNGTVEYVLNLANSAFESWRKENPTLDVFEYPFSIENMGTASPLFDLVKLGDVCKNYFSRLKASEVYEKTLAWAEVYDKEFAVVLKDNKQLSINALNIDREIERPRKDIATFSDVRKLYDYIFNEIFDKNKLLNFDAKFSKEVVNKFILSYMESYEQTDKDTWFQNVKAVAEKCGFCTDNKVYKQNPTLYAGNTADACNILRVAITGRSQTPDLYSIMQTLGTSEVKSRLKFVLNH